MLHAMDTKAPELRISRVLDTDSECSNVAKRS